MKNQYAGDINDFRKYGLIRALTEPCDLPTHCCWMLTPDEGGSDGAKISYLADAARWRGHDPPLFDAMASVVANPQGRRLATVEASGVLRETRFHSGVIPDDAEGRAVYFEAAARGFGDADLVFFDPDNGLEVASKRRGHSGSSKYLYWDEVERAFSEGASVLVYQHFPRKKRGPYTDRRVQELLSATDAQWIATFSTSHVLFLLAPQPRHEEALILGVRLVEERWGAQFEVARHRPLKGSEAHVARSDRPHARSRGILVSDGTEFSLKGFRLVVTGDGEIAAELDGVELRPDLTVHWLAIAVEHVRDAKVGREALVASIADEWLGDHSAPLEAEFRASMQAIVASAIALEAFHSSLRDRTTVPPETLQAWRENRTARWRQVAEVIRLAFNLEPETHVQIRKSVREIFKYRDWAVHPRARSGDPVRHELLDAGTEWRFVAFTYENAHKAVGAALAVVNNLCRATPKSRPAVVEFAQNLRTRLEPLVEEWIAFGETP